MANIHFVKEGSGEQYAKRVHVVDISDATEKFAKFAVHFSEAGPQINLGNPVLKESSYKCVVLEVEPGEENLKFPKAGYYIIQALAPIECARMFGVYF